MTAHYGAIGRDASSFALKRRTTARAPLRPAYFGAVW